MSAASAVEHLLDQRFHPPTTTGSTRLPSSPPEHQPAKEVPASDSKPATKNTSRVRVQARATITACTRGRATRTSGAKLLRVERASATTSRFNRAGAAGCARSSVNRWHSGQAERLVCIGLGQMLAAQPGRKPVRPRNASAHPDGTMTLPDHRMIEDPHTSAASGQRTGLAARESRNVAGRCHAGCLHQGPCGWWGRPLCCHAGARTRVSVDRCGHGWTSAATPPGSLAAGESPVYPDLDPAYQVARAAAQQPPRHDSEAQPNTSNVSSRSHSGKRFMHPTHGSTAYACDRSPPWLAALATLFRCARRCRHRNPGQGTARQRDQPAHQNISHPRTGRGHR